MGLSNAHKGYEYQDLLTSYFIISDLLKGNTSEYKVDVKEYADDKFDDLTVTNNNEIVKRQIKYSDDKTVAKDDFSSIEYDLALDVLYNSWEKMDHERDVSIKILLAWDYNDDIDFLEEVGTSNDFTSPNVKQYRINIDEIWLVGEERPISSWRRLRNNTADISRDNFKEFLQDLKVELCLPKASLDIVNKGEMERITVECLKNFGVGIYPNHEISPEGVLLKLLNIVKNARANQKTLKTHQIVSALGLVVGYGNIEQLFPVDLSSNIYDENTFEKFYSNICKNNKTVLIGEPGSGKSWFVTNFIEYLKSQNILFARHYCYTSLDDIFYTGRITSNIFMANLINDIILACPELKDIKISRFGVDENELQLLIDHVDKEIVLIIDGLDHIERIKSSHESTVEANKTDIIEMIKRISVPTNVKIIVVAQPVSEVLELCEQNYTLTEIENWDANTIGKYLEKRGIGTYEKVRKESLSSYLLTKSNGNPLYVTYLVNELSKSSVLDSWEDTLSSIPDYNDDLKNYYNYLLKQIDEDHKVVYVLSGASFYLSIGELKAITGLGNYVEKRIMILRSILKESAVNGGFIIYHESFRRYILELLEGNGLSIYDNIYKDLIMWLESTGVYSNIKAFNNLFRLLYESGQYDTLLKYANVEFVSESFFRGYGFDVIKKNSDYIVKAATKKKSFSKLVLLSELSNIVLNAEFDYEIYAEKYLTCIGQIHGFQWLSAMLIYEGKANMPLKEGLRVCYACSRNFVIPPWKIYINGMLEKNKSLKNLNEAEIKEQLKYLTAAAIDMDKNQDGVISYATDTEDKEYMKIVLNEYIHRDRLAELISLLTDMELMEQWRGLIEGTDQGDLNEEYVKDILNTVKTAVSIYGDETESKIKYLVANAMKIYEAYSCDVDALIEKITDLSWFHNWIIFVFQACALESESEINGNKLVQLYSNLNRVTAVANHGIRTMDLYGLRQEIYDTIQKPLRNAILCKTEWEQILSIIVESSSDTMVTFQNALMGPLTTDRLFELVTEISNEENYDFVLKHFGEVTEEQKTRRIHMNLADYYMQKSICLYKNRNEQQGIHEFRNAIRMIMSYGQHRDRTLSRLMDTVEDIYGIDSEKGKRCIKQLGAMSIAVVRQTDGKETSDYENEWSQLLCKYDPELALKKFIVDSEIYKRSWICENTLETILTDCLTPKYSRIGNALFKAMPNKSSSDFIQAYLNNIAVIDKDEEVLLARTSVVDLISKFKFNDDADAYEVEEQFIETVTCLCEKYGIDCDLVEAEGCPATSSTDKENNTQITETLSDKGIDEKNIYEVFGFMKSYGYSEEVNNAVKIYLKNIEEISQEVMFVINQLVDFAFESPVSRKYSDIQERVICLGERDEIIDSVRAYLNLRIYLTKKDGWSHKYNSYEFFTKAYYLDKKGTVESYFEYFGSMYKPFESVNGLSETIIKMLSGLNEWQEEVLALWELVYDVIDLRLSCRVQIEWEQIEREFEGYCIEELLLHVLLTRLRYGTADIHKSVFASLETMFMQNAERTMFIRPFKRVLANHSKYINLSIAMLIQLVEDMYSHEEREKYKLVNLDDYICINGDDGFLLKFLLNDEMEERVKPKLQATDQDFNDYILRDFKSIYSRYKLLEDRGVSVDDYILEFFSEIHSEHNRRVLSDTYMDNKSSLLMDNIQIHSDYLKAIGNAVINYLYSEKEAGNVSRLRSFEDKEYFYHSIREDVLLLNAISNSAIVRPNGIPHPSDVSDSVTSVDEKDWIRLAYVEREYMYAENLWRAKHIGDNCKIYQTYSAVGFGKSKRLPLYHDSYRGSVLNHIYPKYMCNPVGLKGKEVVVFTDASLRYNPFLTYYRYDYLAFTFEVLSLLKITMKSTDNGLIGEDSEGKCVLKYQNWCTYKYLTGEEERTPVLRGSQLLVSKETFNKLVSEIGHEPYCHTTSKLIFGEV